MTFTDKFTVFNSSAPKVFHHDGDYSVWATIIGGSWSWVLWLKDTPLDGRKDWNMDAETACREGLEALAARKAADARPYFTDTI